MFSSRPSAQYKGQVMQGPWYSLPLTLNQTSSVARPPSASVEGSLELSAGPPAQYLSLSPLVYPHWVPSCSPFTVGILRGLSQPSSPEFLQIGLTQNIWVVPAIRQAPCSTVGTWEAMALILHLLAHWMWEQICKVLPREHGMWMPWKRGSGSQERRNNNWIRFGRMMQCKWDQERRDNTGVGRRSSGRCHASVGKDLWGGAQGKKKLMLGQDPEWAGAPSCLSLHLVLMRQGLPIEKGLRHSLWNWIPGKIRAEFLFLDTYQGETHTPLRQIRQSL